MAPLPENETIKSATTHNSAADTETTSVENVSSQPAPAFSISAGGDDPETIAEGGNVQGDVRLGAAQDQNGEDEKGETAKMPFGLEDVSNAKDAVSCLYKLYKNGTKVVEIVKESEDIVSDVGDLEWETDEILSTFKYFQGKGDEALTKEDKLTLEAAGELFEEVFSKNFEQVTDHAAGGYQKVSKFQGIDSKSKELQAAMQEAYYQNDEGMVENLGNLIDGIEDYNSKGLSLTSTAKSFIPTLANSKLIEDLEGYSGKLTEYGEKMKSVLDVAGHLGTLYENVGGPSGNFGGQAESLDSMMSLIDTGMTLIDIPALRFATGMWTYVYKPMIDFCITGIAQIEKNVGDNARKITGIRLRNWQGIKLEPGNIAPKSLQGAMNERFEGGWEVFNFMWNVMCDEWHRIPNDTVVEYFENNYDRINSGAGGKNPIPYKGNILTGWSIDSTSLMFWARKEKLKLWAMFYGNDIPYPPGFKAPS